MVTQGELYWIDFGYPSGSEAAFKRPFLIIQNNIFNASRVNTVVGCILTSNLKRKEVPGCVLLKKGEANLSKESVINTTQLYTINKHECFEKIGQLSERRIKEVIKGIYLLIEPKEILE